MLRRVEEYMDQFHMVEPGDIVIAGVSGGADSMCLLFVLDELKKKKGFDLIVVHVNHCLRGEAADRDEEYVLEECKKRDLRCEVFREDVKGYAGKMKLSEEEAGREIRRQAYEETLRKYHGTKIALAHHQEDNAETFFLHLTRGCRLKGLVGINPVKDQYIRPLLCVSRSDIEEFLEDLGIRYCTDETNFEEVYLRNKIRHKVLPYLKKEINEKSVDHINETMEQLRQIREYLDHQVDLAFTRCVEKTEGGLFIRKNAFLKEEELIRGMILNRALCMVAKKEKDLENRHVTALQKLMENQCGRSIDLPYGLYALRTYDGISLLSEKPMDRPEGEEIVLDLRKKKGQISLAGGMSLSWSVFEKDADHLEVPKKSFTKWFDYDIIKNNVVIRTRRPKDRIVIDKQGTTKKLKAFFINEKVPAQLRGTIPLIAKGDQILWIVGYRQSKAYQVTDQTKNIIEITIHGGIENGRQD